MKDYIKIHENDNVIVAIQEIAAGETVKAGGVQAVAKETIPAGHKMALCDIAQGGEVIKYGFRIGNAKEEIAAGSWIHTHNVKTALGDLLEYSYEPAPVSEETTSDAVFMG